MSVISVRQLGKQYRLGLKMHNTLRDQLTALFRREGNAPVEDFWALKDVSFDVEQGEVLGVIGRNGAGKSTLLKILSQITDPTEGEVRIRGRVASLLEVGTGVHPELSGRENVFLNGAILGMTRREIRGKFDEIVAFAEVEKFIDTPVKHYSSGMYVRLAFAVAAHLNPEILIIDEVLAVGDAAFQKKCLGKMEGVAREGRTVLFVSHNMIAVQSLCTKALTLVQGHLADLGEAGPVVSRYLADFGTSSLVREWSDIESAPGDERLRLRRVAVVPTLAGAEISARTPLRLEVEFSNRMPDAALHVTMLIQTEHGITAFASNSLIATGEPQRYPAGDVHAACEIPGDLLNSGLHRVSLLIVRDGASVILSIEDAVAFEVAEPERRSGAWFGKLAGVVRPRLNWNIKWVAPLLATR